MLAIKGTGPALTSKKRKLGTEEGCTAKTKWTKDRIMRPYNTTNWRYKELQVECKPRNRALGVKCSTLSARTTDYPHPNRSVHESFGSLFETFPSSKTRKDPAIRLEIMRAAQIRRDFSNWMTCEKVTGGNLKNHVF